VAQRHRQEAAGSHDKQCYLPDVCMHNNLMTETDSTIQNTDHRPKYILKKESQSH